MPAAGVLVGALKWWNQPAIGAEWLFLNRGIGASNHFEAGGFIRSSDEFDWPNIQYHFLPVAINYNGSNPIKIHGFQAHMGSMRSPSRGRVHLRSKDPHQHPSILFNYMSTEQDWAEFRAGIRITREIMRQPALKPYAGREITPGEPAQTDAELDAYVRQHAETAYHPCGTNAMGMGEMAVVDGARPGARPGRPAGGRCVHHAGDHHRQPQRADHHDGRKDRRQDPRSHTAAAVHSALLRGRRHTGTARLRRCADGIQTRDIRANTLPPPSRTHSKYKSALIGR